MEVKGKEGEFLWERIGVLFKEWNIYTRGISVRLKYHITSSEKKGS